MKGDEVAVLGYTRPTRNDASAGVGIGAQNNPLCLTAHFHAFSRINPFSALK